jgi:hypothetical protein
MSKEGDDLWELGPWEGHIGRNHYLPADVLPTELLGPEAGDTLMVNGPKGWERQTNLTYSEAQIIIGKGYEIEPIPDVTKVNGVLWRDPVKGEADVATEPAAPEMPRVDPIQPITVRLTVAEARRILATRITAARALDASIAELEAAINAQNGGTK